MNRNTAISLAFIAAVMAAAVYFIYPSVGFYLKSGDDIEFLFFMGGGSR